MGCPTNPYAPILRKCSSGMNQPRGFCIIVFPRREL